VLVRFDARNNTSMPLNLYGLFLYRNFVWTEWAFRLPVAVAGLLAVVAIPVLLRPIFGDRASLMTAFLLAISPFLIFYSRFYRAYEFVALLGFAALLLAYRWLTTGRRRWGVGFLVTGIAAIYFHLLAAVAVFAPLAAALGIALTRRSSSGCPTPAGDEPVGQPASQSGKIDRRLPRSAAESPLQERFVVSTRTILAMALGLAVCLIPLCIPILLANDDLPWAKGTLSASGFVTAATLISGTSNVVLNVLFFSLWIGGHAALGRRNPVLNWVFLCTFYAYVLATLIARPTGCNEGRLLLRYSIVVLPMALSMVAFALDRLLQMPWAQKAGAVGRGGMLVALLTCLGAAGPLPAIYSPPNDFSNHAAFQGAYSPLAWEHSDAPPRREYPGPSLEQSQAPQFYHRLAAMQDVAAIIEYPYDVCNFNDQLYYYQHFHKKRVLVGYYVDPALNDYSNDLSPEQVRDGFDTTGVYLDGIFYYVPDRGRLGFCSIVDLADADAIARSGADVVVLHKSAVVMTTAPHGRIGQCRVFYHYVDAFRERFQRQFGPPLYEDDVLLCFRLRKPKP
jgi:hypothetical protein